MEQTAQKKKRLPWIIAGAAAVAAAGIYIGGGLHYKQCFLPKTLVNGIEASGRTWEDVEKEMLSVLDTYQLTITGRNGITDIVTSDSIDMAMDFGGSVKNAQEAQNPWSWPAAFFKGEDIVLESVLSYNEEKLASLIKTMNCKDETQAIAPSDAHISEYEKGTGFSIVPEQENNRLKKDIFEGLVADSLMAMDTELTLEELEAADAYKHPKIYKDNELLNSQLEQMNKLTKASITYDFDGRKEVADGAVIAQWLTVNEQDGSVFVDASKAREFVNSLARQYDTYNGNGTRDFKTSYGAVVTIQGGDYGWWMNRVQTTEELVKAVEAGEQKTLEPVYYQKAASYSGVDYGNSYVEINLTAQHLYLYKNGKKILETDFVSGKPSVKNSPSGVYSITYKERAHTMNGTESDPYRVETSFWMPFAGNVGMHDAMWRRSFGGDLYVTGGSHGCINLPYNAAKAIYENIDSGFPVICYRLNGTESSTTTGQSDQEIANIGLDAISRIGTVSRDNYNMAKKKIEWARQVYTDLTEAQRKYVTNYQVLVDAEKALAALQ